MSDQSTETIASNVEGPSPVLEQPAIEEKKPHIKELELFVSDRTEAGNYLKLLGEEVNRLEASRTRHAYLVWLLIAAFFVADQRLGELPLLSFEKLDRDLLLKTIPAAIAFFYYVTTSRTFLIKEIGSMQNHLADLLYPSEYFPLGDYISAGSFMRSEKLLHTQRPQEEVLGYIFLMAVMVSIAVFVPVIACLYGYYSVISSYTLHDGVVQLSVVVGILFLTQAFVINRGNALLIRERIGGRARLNWEPIFVRRKE